MHSRNLPASIPARFALAQTARWQSRRLLIRAAGGYTSGMTTATTTSTRRPAFLARHGRLLALGGLSLLLHAAVIAWFDARLDPPPPPLTTPGLAVRLSEAPPLPAPAPPPAPVTDIAPEPDDPAPPAPPDPVTQIAPATTPSAAPALTKGSEIPQTPSRYRVAMPPAVTLVYDLRDAAGTTGEATLRWDTDGVRYRLALDGILGEIESQGGTDDAGIAPQRASYRLGAGNAAVAFDRDGRAIVFEGVGRSVQDLPGSQDGATVLMQLAGIGLADPDQVQEAVDIYVARLDGAAVERYAVTGRERLETPLGTLETVRLARAGSPRLEVWLAPARGWLPVQLRVGAPDGSARTQVIKEIRNAPAG